MNPERLSQVEELYHAARERPPEDRAELLAQVEPELRREVESLLAQDGESVLDRPAIEVAANLLEDSSAERLAVGAPLGPYKIESSIGAGGMGEVYKARDTRLGRAVAIKVSSHQFNTRFEREARAISALNHPHICTLHDIGTEGEMHYLVFEYLVGEPLSDRLARGALPLSEALESTTQIAGALAYAHEMGIIHLDLKPSNIMMMRNTVKLFDFGIAELRYPDLPSSPSSVTGTLGYMSPEQLESSETDFRTDVFAMGVVMYEMITGRPAFPARGSLEAAILNQKECLQPMSQLQPEVPPEVDRLVTRCLARDPSDRLHSMAELLAQLKEIDRGR